MSGDHGREFGGDAPGPNEQPAASCATDAQLIRASVGDPAAFWRIFERHYDALFAFLARRLGRDAADDLATDVFLTAFSQRDRYDQRHPDARPWLFGIATNLVRRHRRSEVRRFRAYAREAGRLDVEHDEDEADRLDSRAAGPALAKALASMPADQREVLLLVAWAGLSPDEVSRALNIAPGTVRSRLSRARARARHELRRDPYEDLDTDGPLPFRKEATTWMTSN
ncbi:MAG TPA: RNA polymerase sigma factor [Actinomycetota bacterium]